MHVCWFAAALTLAAISATPPAYACAMLAQMDFRDIGYADVVVVGQVVNYEIVRDPVVRKRHQRFLDSLPPSSKLPETLAGPKSFVTDYARFDIVVGEVLRGKAAERVTVTLDNSTFGEPDEMGPGPFLIALRDPNSPMPPLRGASATLMPNPAPATLTVLQAPCAGPFMFETSSKEAGLVRRMLDGRAE